MFLLLIIICAMVKSRYIGDGHPTFNRNPYNGYINPYYWVDDYPLLYGNNRTPPLLLHPPLHLWSLLVAPPSIATKGWIPLRKIRKPEANARSICMMGGAFRS